MNYCDYRRAAALMTAKARSSVVYCTIVNHCLEDQLDALERSVTLSGESKVNLANLTDGLRAEREQGITIDVAYRYLATPKRKFIIADTPGHIQYTRNMVTGASTANLAVILIDARKGVIEQTRRHSFIASLLGIPHLVLCVNKMDLVDFDKKVYDAICDDYEKFSSRLEIKDITYIPMSALEGDNIVDLSGKMPWYKGPSFLSFLETLHIVNDRNFSDPRFPVQWVIRPRSDEYHDFRAFSGQMACGVFNVGDDVLSLPSGKRSRIKEILNLDQSLDLAFTPMSAAIRLEDEIDVSRGDVLVHPDHVPYVSNEIEAMLCWMHEMPLLSGRKYFLKHLNQTSRAVIKEVIFRTDINNLTENYDAPSLSLNEIGKVKIKTQAKLVFDDYKRCRNTGSFILIDEATHATVASGMICEPANDIPMPQYDGYVI